MMLCPPLHPTTPPRRGQPLEVFIVGPRPSQGQLCSSSHTSCIESDMATALIQIPAPLPQYQ